MDTKAWASWKLAGVTLDTEVAASTSRRAAYRISQSADNLSVVVGDVADALSYLVPEGHLTEVPAG